MIADWRRYSRLLLGVATSVLLTGCADDSAERKTLRTSVNASILVAASWLSGDVPTQFATNALDGEIRVQAALLPRFRKPVELPSALLVRIRNGMEDGRREEVRGALASLRAWALQ